jgi:phosphate-selective porin OprO and OprP
VRKPGNHSLKFFGKTLQTLALLGALGAPLWAQETASRTAADIKLDEVLARLATIERRLTALEGSTTPTPAPAREGNVQAAPSISDLAARVEAIDEQVRIVDRKREIDQEALTSRFSQSPVVEAGRDGFWFRSSDNNFQFKIGGYFQADSRFFVGSGQVESNTFVLRRVRPVFTGTFYKGIEFRLMPDWGLGQSVLQDLHLDFRFFPKASVRFGKFKAPFSLERLQSATDITFVERAFPTNLAPNRDTGVQMYGDFAAGTFSYAVALMNGVPDGGSSDLDTNDGKDLVGRVFFQPFIRRGVDHKGSGLGLGISASQGRQTGATLPVYRTTPQSAFFNYVIGTTADGDRKRLGPQGHYYIGPFGLLAEYTVTEQDVRRGGTTATIKSDGWQVAASYFLTGERKAYRTPAPRKAFNPQDGGKGAFEVSARYTELSVGQSAFQLGFADPARSARKAQEWTGGLTWHIARGNKFILNYSQTNFTGGSASGNRPTEKALLSRFQVAF